MPRIRELQIILGGRTFTAEDAEALTAWLQGNRHVRGLLLAEVLALGRAIERCEAHRRLPPIERGA